MTLKQKRDESFAVFFSIFYKLSNIFEYFDSMLIDDLKDKVLSRLREALANTQIRHISLIDLKIYLQDLNDDQKALMIDKERREKYEQIRKQAQTISIKSYLVIASMRASISISSITTFAIIIISRFTSKLNEVSRNVNC